MRKVKLELIYELKIIAVVFATCERLAEEEKICPLGSSLFNNEIRKKCLNLRGKIVDIICEKEPKLKKIIQEEKEEKSYFG
jgi:hypothetical protein